MFHLKLLFIIISLLLVVSGCSTPAVIDGNMPQASKIFDSNGEVVAVLSHENRIPVPLESVSPYMQEAIVAIEDSRFYNHHGIDPVGIIRALYRNIQAGKVVEGGSTITQQLAKNLYLDQRRTVGRKLEELVLTIQLERKYTKKEILGMYLNEIYFGQGAYGIEAAARTYFDKNAKELGLAESAMLAGIPKAPSTYNPSIHFDSAKARQAAVLERMVELGMLEQQQAQQAREEYLQPLKTLPYIKKAPYFTDEIIKHFETNYPNGLENVYSGGLSIYTTLDLNMQVAAEKALTEGLQGSDPRLNGALIAIDPRNGHIKAMVGGRDYGKSQLNRSLAKSQPGSTFKPFLYTAVIDRGYTAATTIRCEPVSFPQAGGDVYRPIDYQGYYHNRSFTLKEALFTSDNVIAVRLADIIGPAVVVSYANKMGIDSTLRPFLSLPLGTSEVSPLEMARAYGTLANGGIRTDPFYIQKVTDGTGRILEEGHPKLQPVLDEKTAYIVTDMLSGVLKPGGTASHIAEEIGRPSAGKTGTTENFRDAWFVGYTPQLVAAVYIGHDDKNNPVGRTGGQVAAPIWAAFMSKALKGVPATEFPVPQGIVHVGICPDDGLRAGEFHRQVIMAAFVQGTEPISTCDGAAPGGLVPQGTSGGRVGLRSNPTWPNFERLFPRRVFEQLPLR